ncbi:MAG: hypothetical protein ACYTG7_18650 [Planctomycetota bacterium]
MFPRISLPTTLLFILIATNTLQAQHGNPDHSDFPILKDPYLGQEPPGMEPVLFAPGVISTEAHEFSCTIHPDGKEFFFTRRKKIGGPATIMVTKWTETGWTRPQPAPVIGDYDGFEPSISPDGQKLFFKSWRPVPGGKKPTGDIWIMHRKGEEWGPLEHLVTPFNPDRAMYISVTNDGTIYTTDITGGFGNEKIVLSRLTQSGYSDYETVGPPVSVGEGDMYPFIAPDESYLLFCSKRKVPGGDSGLFVTFPLEDGSWCDPKPVDTGMICGCPYVSTDGKYLFFTSIEGIYWVDAMLFKRLMPKALKRMEAIVTRPDASEHPE